ncbi:MAG: tRNA (guanosine(37)-N1)-methyltransferase TrmD [Dehalococcoidales bacterium]|nr:tRNA (guanosine(37)-N1)-methyltransferase TrmD [Dehalococcoidales bacterium]
MRIDILTLFPKMFEDFFSTGISQRAVTNKLVEVNIHNIRDYTHDKHHIVDDYAYGGGAGMVMKPEPIFEAVEHIKRETAGKKYKKSSIVLTTPQGRLFSQGIANELTQYDHLIIICGHYEGVDERVQKYLATDEISIGDYVLSGGEPAAMVVVDAVTRLLPGVLGSEESAKDDSHTNGLLEYPQYTRPEVFREWTVPEILLSGNHGEIAKWRREQSILRTARRRPDLLEKANLNNKEIQQIRQELNAVSNDIDDQSGKQPQ